MHTMINNININYKHYKNDSNITLVYLHGWGQNIQMMEPIANPFIKQYDVLIVDLPGFGLSEEPKSVWSLNDYVQFLHELFKKLNIGKKILIGHSFGGRISLLYASKYEVEKLILFGSPYKKEIEKLTLKMKILKTAKKMPGMKNISEIAKKYIGSSDYKNASPMMRNILVETVNLDLTENVKKIKCPTILIWGTLDEQVGIERAKELEQLIPDAALIIYDNCTHYAYLENLEQTINIIKSFIS